jgi:hypothetical protein
MTEIVLVEPLASQIRETADAEGIAVEDLIESALRKYRFHAQQVKLDEEAQWWRDVSPDLKATYAGEYVAVHHRQVVDHDRDEQMLRQRVRVQFGKQAVWVAPAIGRREWRLVSTRLGRS